MHCLIDTGVHLTASETDEKYNICDNPHRPSQVSRGLRKETQNLEFSDSHYLSLTAASDHTNTFLFVYRRGKINDSESGMNGYQLAFKHLLQ